jgi:hypothetical protein
MAREFNGPLTPDDLEWLMARFPQSRIDRLVEVNGLAASETAREEPEGSEAVKGEGSTAEGVENPEESLEDLIGSSAGQDFNPQDHTEAEIAAHLKANPDDKERVLALEAEGRGRKGVLAL